MKKYIVSLDQGTTSSRAVLFDLNGKIIDINSMETNSIYPKSGWVEQDPKEILQTQIQVIKNLLTKNNVAASEIMTIGITNQRETSVIWNKNTGEPVYNAIIWQCRRTSDECQEIKNSNKYEIIKDKTGLEVDAYFSASKYKWILDNVEGARERAINGELIAGTIDSWLIWNLTKGKSHVTDVTNASRTMLFNVDELIWDNELLAIFDIPKCMLPEVLDSNANFGTVDKSILGDEVSINGVLGDQQAALFGQVCFNKGDMKNTYGTGCFLLVNTGQERKVSNYNLLSTIAWRIDGKVEYAIEGSVFVAGAAVQWLRDKLGIITKANETEELAKSVEDSKGVYFVPAFNGLGAPYWNMDVKGGIYGLTGGCDKRHIVRATLEALAYQASDLIKAMEKDLGYKITEINVDGGASNNEFLMQFQADILDAVVKRPSNIETTAQGAAFMAGLGVGHYKNKEEIVKIFEISNMYSPKMSEWTRDEKLEGWKNAIEVAIKEAEIRTKNKTLISL